MTEILPKNQILTKEKSTPGKKWKWGSFLFGFVIGLASSLIYGWLIEPRPLPISPADLKADHKVSYLRLIAVAFAYDHDEAKARTRLATVDDPNIKITLIKVTEQFINQEKDIRDILALVNLTESVGEVSPPMMAFLTTLQPPPTLTPIPTPTPIVTPSSTPTRTPTRTSTPTPSPTRSPTPTFTPSSTATPTSTPSPTLTATPTTTNSPFPTATATTIPTPTLTPTPDPHPPFKVVQSLTACDEISEGLLKIYVHDRLGNGVAEVEIVISWPNGQDRFFTGFKPDIDSGYADFQMKLAESYQIKLVTVKTSGQLPEITFDKAICQNGHPSWQIVFQQ